MTSRAMRLLRLLLLLALGQPSLGHAQAIRGRVVDAVQGLPVAGALVELQDSTGRALQRGVSSPSGSFRFVTAGPAMYRVRIAAIGYTMRPVDAVRVTDADAVMPDVRLEPAATILPDVIAAGKRRACGPDILADPLLSRLLEGGRASLTLIEATLGVGARFTVQEVVTRTVDLSRGTTVRADTSRRQLTAWPLQSVDPETLRREGFSRQLTPEEGRGRVYNGPDLRVLFADWFIDSHCFSFNLNDKDEAAGVIRVKYEPQGKSKLVDVSGELVIDAANLALREFSFVHRNLPKHIKEGKAGGMIAFARLESGAWLPVRWEIFAPIESNAVTYPTGRSIVISGGRPVSPRPIIRPIVNGSVQLTGALLDVRGN
ncbi:MAG: carboxypeptidase regulatory-like domain-containing protein [Gemmatimonadetes bacterium]|nr:carboxypeptidase regulatory-like domain-containing protein [Gemmatimonadota bacterium]